MPSDTRERCLLRQGRAIAWTETGPDDGAPLVRFPGTPGCRWSLLGDRRLWQERNLRVIVPERPGFGASTRLPRWRFPQCADDVAAILDHLGVERTLVMGFSGGGPHVLSFAGCHPDRVSAATVVVGAAPLTYDEADQLIEVNRDSYGLAVRGDTDGLGKLVAELRRSLLDDPVTAFRGLMADAPAEDQAILADPVWQRSFTRGLTEALRATGDGWVDEAMAIFTGFDDIDLHAVRCTLTWWHSAADHNVPLAAARRVIDRIPGAVLQPMAAGHLTPYVREADILDELLSRHE